VCMCLTPVPSTVCVCASYDTDRVAGPLRSVWQVYCDVISYPLTESTSLREDVYGIPSLHLIP